MIWGLRPPVILKGFMAEKKVPFSADWGFNQVKTEAWTDENRIFVESKQKVDEIAIGNRREYNESCVRFNSKFQRNDSFRKVATIPNIKVDELMRTGQWKDKKYMKKWLNDQDNNMWRTSAGVV